MEFEVKLPNGKKIDVQGQPITDEDAYRLLVLNRAQNRYAEIKDTVARLTKLEEDLRLEVEPMDKQVTAMLIKKYGYDPELHLAPAYEPEKKLIGFLPRKPDGNSIPN